MDKTITILVILIVILSTVILFLSVNSLITGRVIEERNLNNDFSYTKAICDESNYCQDNIIRCNGNKLISITPITGAAVQFPPNWQDPRNQEDIDKLCD